MLGHTGNLAATIKAIECIDHCLANILKTIESTGAELLITADHGNADCLVDPISHQPHTAHTTARVPFVYVGRAAHITHTNGTLADIAPTMLTLLALRIPTEMTGTSLLALQHTQAIKE
jgi:2,3-bisphosphoglycerate-independent phosphoglycerate mutase